MQTVRVDREPDATVRQMREIIKDLGIVYAVRVDGQQSLLHLIGYQKYQSVTFLAGLHLRGMFDKRQQQATVVALTYLTHSVVKRLGRL